MAVGDYMQIGSKHIPAYQRVFRALIKTHGNSTRAIAACGISDHAYYRLINDGELVASVARKIVDCYQKSVREKA